MGAKLRWCKKEGENVNVHIEINSEDGITSKVIVNGTDISDYVSSVEYLHRR